MKDFAERYDLRGPTECVLHFSKHVWQFVSQTSKTRDGLPLRTRLLEATFIVCMISALAGQWMDTESTGEPALAMKGNHPISRNKRAMLNLMVMRSPPWLVESQHMPTSGLKQTVARSHRAKTAAGQICVPWPRFGNYKPLLAGQHGCGCGPGACAVLLWPTRVR